MSAAPRDDTTSEPAPGESKTREELMKRHAEARRRRDTAALASDEFRAAAEEVARIEIAIAALEEPPPSTAD